MKTCVISQSIGRLRRGLSATTLDLFAAQVAKHCLTLLAILFMSQTASRADVSLSLQIWHGYDFYYPSLSLSASNPDPATYDRVESPNGIIWKNFGTNTDSNPFFLTNDLAAVLNECNGSWKLYVNKGDSSEQLYHFTVSITGVTTNLFGNVVVLSPADGSTGVSNQPMFYWSGPTNLSYVNVDVYHDNVGNSYNDTLPGTATNWVPPGVLTPGNNNFFIQYYSNNLAGFTFATPTNSSGTLSGWAAEGDVFSYIFSFFSVMTNSSGGGGGGGGHTNLLYYSFEDGQIFATDYSPNGNNVQTIWSTGGGSAYTTNTQTIGNYAAYFSNNGGSGGSWLTPPTNLLATLAGSFSVSLWVNTTQATGNDTDDGLYGNAGLVSAFNGSGGNWVVPMAITGNKLAFATGGSTQSTLHSATDINTGSYVHLVVTRNQSTGEKKIYVNGALDATETGSTDSLDTPDELDIGYNNGTGFDGRMDEIQIYSGVLSAADVASLYASPGTTIPDVTGSGPNGPVVHYDFDEGTVLAADVSGNNNDVVYAGSFSGSGPSISSDTVAGSGSVSFDGGSYLTASSNLLATLAGDFTVSLWLKTGQNFGSQYDPAWAGAGVITADSPNSGAKDLIPVALTGGQVAFNIGDGSFDSTLNSSATVNDDAWHHVVVTRNQSTGERQIFIDGMLDSSDFATTVLLDSPVLLTIGAKSDASDPNPSSPDYNGSNGYEGLLDDVQIYNRVLGSNEVAFLYSHPGAIIANSDFGPALNTTNVTWTTEGDGNWFTETATSLDGLAAQSGAITNSQTSAVQTTAPADGQVSFQWKVSSEQDFDYLTFYINGVQQDAISGEVDWTQDTFDVSAGDVLRWEYSKDGSDSAGQDAGWLDQVVLPGATLAQYPVDVDLQFNISRSQDPNYGEIYGGGVSFNSVSPDPTTTNSVHSPHDYFVTETYPGGSWGSGAILSTLDQAINEFTNGLWKIYINQGSPTQQVYSFQVSITGLDTNLLKAVKILSPTNGSVNVHANAPFYWTGPTNFSSLNLDLAGVVNLLSLPLTATNWASAPTLSNGSQFFDLNYSSNNFPGVTFSTPVDASSNPVRTWSTTVNLSSVAFSLFFVGPNPTQLTQPQLVGPNFQFAFLSQTGVTNSVQYRTNLVLGTWLTYSNVVGDGSLKTIPIPISVFNGARQGFVRISSQ